MSNPKTADVAEFRNLFPGTERWTYLDVAARGLVSTNVRAAIDHYLDERMHDGANKEQMFALIEETRARFAKLINARPEEIAFSKNVSDGINAFATALPWRAGDNVVICESLEHPANVFVWHALRRAKHIEIKTVPPQNGRIPLEETLAAIDARTRLVAVSSVSFSPGFRFPVAELGKACRERGVLLLVDAAQSAGILRTDVARDQVDALAVSTQKGLLGLYGMGFLFVRSEVAERLEPIYLSRMGVDLGQQHEAAAGPASTYRLAESARRFDVGNFNYLGAAAVNQSMRDLEALGAMQVESYVCRLAAELSTGLRQLGVPLLADQARGDGTHIVPVGRGISAEHDSTDDEELLDLHRHLAASRVRHTIRRGVLRLSLHAYNDRSDVERVLEVAEDWATGRPIGARRAAAAEHLLSRTTSP